MRRKIISLLVFVAIAGFYALLYLACSVDKCDDACYKLSDVSRSIKKDSLVVYSIQCGTGSFCINVNDSMQRNWNGLADTACQYIRNKGLRNYTVTIISDISLDTLLKQTCP
jgi:hypothetical protein